MGERARQFLSPWTLDCPQDRDAYPLQQLSAECRSIERVACRYHQPEPDFYHHDSNENDINDSRLLKMARASVSTQQWPRSAHRYNIRHEYHNTRECESDQQQPSGHRKRIRPRSALSHRRDIEGDHQRQLTRPQSAKPGGEHNISIDPNDFARSLPPYLKDSKWTAMMQRGQSFRQSNLRRLEQETIELLQSVFRLEQPSALLNKSSNPVSRKTIQTKVACGSGLRLARTKKSQHLDSVGSENEDNALLPETKLKEQQRVREKTKRRTKRKTAPGYMKHTECHAYRLEERQRAAKKPISVKLANVKKQSQPSTDVHAEVADPSRERVLLEMGWLSGDTSAFASENTKVSKARLRLDEHIKRKAASPVEMAPIVVDSDEDNRILAQDKTEPSPQTKQRQEATSLNDKAVTNGTVDLDLSLDTADLAPGHTPGHIVEVSLSNCRSNEVKIGSTSSILSPESDGQFGKCEEDRSTGALEGIDNYKHTHENANSNYRNFDTESKASPTEDNCHEDFESLSSECYVPASLDGDATVHELRGPQSPTSQHWEKDLELYSEISQYNWESESRSTPLEKKRTTKLDVQTEDMQNGISHSTGPELRSTRSPSNKHTIDSCGDAIGDEYYGLAVNNIQGTECHRTSIFHQQSVSVQVDHSLSLLAADETEKSLLVEDCISDSSEQDTPKTGDEWSSSDDGSVSELMNFCEKLTAFPTTASPNAVEEPAELNIPLRHATNVQDELSCPADGSKAEPAAPQTLHKEDAMDQLQLENHHGFCEAVNDLELTSESISCESENVQLKMEDLRGSLFASDSDLSHMDSQQSRSQTQEDGELNNTAPFAEVMNSPRNHAAEYQVVNSDSNGNAPHNVSTTAEIQREVHDEDIRMLMGLRLDTKNDAYGATSSNNGRENDAPAAIEQKSDLSASELIQATVSRSCATIVVPDRLFDFECERDVPVIGTEYEVDAELKDRADFTIEPLQMTEISSIMPNPAMTSDDSTDLLVDAEEMSTDFSTHTQRKETESDHEGRDHTLIPILDLSQILTDGGSEIVVVSSRSPSAVSSSHFIDSNSSGQNDHNLSEAASTDFATQVVCTGLNCHDIESSIHNPVKRSSEQSCVEALQSSSHVFRNDADFAIPQIFVDSVDLVKSLRRLYANSVDNLESQRVNFQQDCRMRLAAQRIQLQYRCFINRRLLIEQSKFLATKHQRQSRKKSRLEAKQLSLAPASVEPQSSAHRPCLSVIQEPTTPLEDAHDVHPVSPGATDIESTSTVETEELVKLDYCSDDGELSLEVTIPNAMCVEKAEPIELFDTLELPPAENDYFSEAFHTESQSDADFADTVSLRGNRQSLSLAAMAFDDADESASFVAETPFSGTSDLNASYPMDFEQQAGDLLSSGCKWERYIDIATQKSFYYHCELQISQWTPPNEPFVDKASPSNAPEMTKESDSTWRFRRNRSMSAVKWGDWQAFVDESTQQTFYYNAKTQESSWGMPVGFQYNVSPEEPVDSPWVMYVDQASGAPYYVNMETNETTWDNPFEYSAEQQPQSATGEEDDYLIALDENSTEFYELG